MIPQQFTIKGSLGILAGLNRDELTMDLTTIPDDAVTIAIKGQNGQGKSTILNLALTPFREPPMLPGTLYDEFGPEGFRELIFDHAGSKYRSQITIKQTAKNKSTKAVLHVHTDDKGWTPVTLPDNTVSDGKTKTYDACLEHILGPRSLYYLSAFRAQNAPKLAEYDDPKGLMSDLLALAEPELYREQAKLVRRELNREYERVRDDHERLKHLQTKVAELNQRRDELQAQVPRLTSAKTGAAEQAAVTRAEFDSATHADADSVKIRQQRDDLQVRIGKAKATGQQNIQQAEGDLSRTRMRLKAAVNAGLNTDGDIASAILHVNTRKQQAEQLLTRREEITTAMAEAEQIAGAISQKEIDLQALEDRLAELHEIDAAIGRLTQNRDHVASNGKTIAAHCDRLKKRAGYIDLVPCDGDHDDCPALQDAIAAKAAVPGAEKDCGNKRAEWNGITVQIDAAQAKREPLANTERDITALRQVIQGLRQQLTTTQAIANQAAALEQAQQTATEAEQEITDLQSRQATAEQQAKAEQAVITQEITELTDRLTQARELDASAVSTLQAELDKMPPPDPAGALVVAQRNMEQAEQALTDATRALDLHQANITDRQAKAASMQSDIDDAESVRQRAEYLAAEIAHWDLLAIGMQGVIDLSIEDAGPAIAATANQLLTEAYGPRFSLRIITQREQANGRLVECFDISVIDSESGLESSILQKSGGESVWLDKALTDAVGIYHQDAAGEHYECLFADESEDGLTAERKQQFYRMDRAALGLGGYQRKFFISHNPEAWAMADHVIDLGEWQA